MKLIKIKKSGRMLVTSDNKARVLVEKLGIATYENKDPVVKKPVFKEVSIEKEEEPKPEIEAEDSIKKKPKKRSYKRRDLGAEE